MTEVEKKYIKLKEFVAFLTGPLGYEVYKKDPSMLETAKDALRILRDEMWEKRIASNPDAVKLNSEIEEYNDFKNLLPINSLDNIKLIDDKIFAISKQLQNIVDYFPELYFQLYFMLNGLSIELADTIKQEGKGLYGFKTWFYGSKVVDDNNQPLILYHGTGENEFTRFSFNMFPGTYFAENKSYSEWFAKLKGAEKGKLFKCYLRVLNPIDLRLFHVNKVKYEDFVAYIELKYGYKLSESKMIKAASDAENGLWAWQYLRGGASWLKEIKEAGVFDGIKFYENNPQDIVNGKENITPAWLVFEPQQIKAVYGNMTYSLESEDIRFEKGGHL
jgi:hypothetical protein